MCINLVASYRFLWIPLSEAIKERHECHIIGICRNNADKSWFERQDKSGVIDDYVVTDVFNDQYGNISDPVDIVHEKAGDFEKQYNCVYPELIQTDRHLGRGYSTLGPGHSRSKLSMKATYIASIDFLNKIFSYWEDFYAKYSPDLAIGGGSGIIEKPFNLVMRKNGVILRSLMYAKYKDYFYWASDEFGTFPGLENKFNQLKKELFESHDFSDTDLKDFSLVSEDNKKYFTINPLKTAKSITRLIARNIYMRLKGINTYANYLLKDQIWEVISRDLQVCYLRHQNLSRLNDIKGRKFFFYALQTEPETSTTTISPEFNEQLAVIQLIAKALPSNYCLVVKEHPFAIGRRPYFLYKLLQQIANVIFIDFRENAMHIAKSATAIITISGSIGYEATVIGKPVITFGHHNWHNFVSNTVVVENFLDIKAAINEVIEKSRNHEHYSLEGKLFLKSICDSAFKWDFNAVFFRGKDKVSKDEIVSILKALEVSFQSENGTAD